MGQPFEDTFILFVDMLGFSTLVEREGHELNELNPIFTGVELYSPSSAESVLGYRFINFHRFAFEAWETIEEPVGAGRLHNGQLYQKLETPIPKTGCSLCHLSARLGRQQG